MPEENTLEIESVRTPKGSVPTVKGLETAVNAVYEGIAPLGELLSSLEASLKATEKRVSQIGADVKNFGLVLSEFLILFGKLDVRLESIITEVNESKERVLISQELDLLKLRDSLAKLLLQVETMTMSHEPKKETGNKDK